MVDLWTAHSAITVLTFLLSDSERVDGDMFTANIFRFFGCIPVVNVFAFSVLVTEFVKNRRQLNLLKYDECHVCGTYCVKGKGRGTFNDLCNTCYNLPASITHLEETNF